MKKTSNDHDEITQILLRGNSDDIKSTLLDLMYEIEESPAHMELPQSMESILDVVARRILERSWSDEILATGFFVLGKAVIYPGKIDVAKIVSRIILKVGSQSEARQILISIENQFLAGRDMDENAVKFILEFLRKSPEVWNDDLDLFERVIEELDERSGTTDPVHHL